MENQVIGHRGAAAHAPENTLAAFECARLLNCRWIEFDVMLSADGQAFIFHDETVSRTTNGRGDFGLLHSSYIRSLDAGSWFSETYRKEKIPTFIEAIQWLKTTGIQANIEIKPYKNTIEQTALVVLDHLKKSWPAEKPWPLISSFAYAALEICKEQAPHLPLGLLLHRWNKSWLKLAKAIGCFSIHLNQHIVTQKRVLDMKNAGYQVFVYTVNSKRQALKLFRWGVDAVFSDNPALIDQ